MGACRRFGARVARLLALVVAVALAAAPSAATASPVDDLVEAQARANRAAGDLAEAEATMARAEDAVAHVQARVETIDARVGAAREGVRDLAIRLYVGGSMPVLRILRMADANDVVRAQQYSRVVAATSMDALEQFRADREDLDRELADLAREQESRAASLEDHQAAKADAIEDLDRLTEVVARAAAAQEAERQDSARRASAAATAGASAESSSGGQSTSGSRATPTPASAPTAPPAPTTATTTPADPDGPGTGSDPIAPSDWICPVQGPHAFSNDYGAPRGGGYYHQGNDILAARGTPVVASVDGEVRHREGAVSGLAYYLDGDDGNEYFGAHLDELGADGRVTAGTIVGYVGNTGDAASTAPHLHFEIHPGGSGYENPYPTLTKYC